MKIYLSHKRGPAQEELYKLVKTVAKHKFILPHENPSETFDSKGLFESKGCDLVLAEVSEPSTGQGIELGWASMLNMPIVCIFKKGTKPARSLNAITDKITEYDNSESLLTYLENL